MSSSAQKDFPQHMSPFTAWAFALGTAVGWGSLVVTSNGYLAEAGPWGSVIGLVIGGLIMLIISRNYAYLMQVCPDPGGAYTWCREAFGYDHGFLAGWFLAITYLAVLWANATSIPLFVRNFIGPLFQFGKMYTLFGYDVYLGETLLTIAAIVLVALMLMRSRKIAMTVMTVLACVFFAGILAVFAAAVTGHGQLASVTPGFLEDSGALSQILHITLISPWAFIGFESISHYSAEFSFQRKRIFRVLTVAVISATILYILVTLLSVTAYPERYGSWLEYIRDRGNLEGLEAFPAFYAASHYMGATGVGLLMAALLALVLSSLIGNTMALSRLFYAMGMDRVLPEKIGRLNDRGLPDKAILMIAGLSLLVPFVGRTAIGWIVDVTTIGATLIYGLVSAAGARTARLRQDRTEQVTGLGGLVLMILFGGSILLPNLVSQGTMERETYFLFIVWTLLGFLFFRSIIQRDREKRFGKSTIVWIAMLSLVLLIALIWMRQTMIATNDRMVAHMQTYYAETADSSGLRDADARFFEHEVDEMEHSNIATILEALGMFGFALVIMLTNHSYMNRRNRESEMILNVDPMTGVKSKHAYLQREKELNEGIRSGRDEAFAVTVCDVNGLKKINDTLGHKAGDEYICEAARMICEIYQHSPVYRIGGDEFVVIMTRRDYENRDRLKKMLHDVSVVHISGGGAVVSGGVSAFQPGKDTCFHDVFERADQLMYEEKKLLKGLGAVSRDEDPELPAEEENASVLDVRKQILIIEDSEINQMMLVAIMEEDYDILSAMNGAEALELLQDEKDNVSAVLLDLQMPVMDGKTLLMKMKADPDLKQIPVIVMTGDEKAEVESLRLGAMDFIPKPYPDQEIIRARVRKCIELSEIRATIQSTERDPLTGLYNMEYFTRYVELYDRHYADMPMDAVVLDINRFHLLNERYGKIYGDSVLRRLGGRLRVIAREVGGVACYRGADTFLLYCPQQDSYEGMLERISEGISGEGGESADRVKIRMGVYSRADKRLDTGMRFDRAQAAADAIRDSHAKLIGEYTEKMHQEALLRERLLEDFRPSLEQERFRVYFQPKFDIRPEKPVLASAEALVRWDHPEMGMLSPAQFIPLLEEHGLILELDRYVWRRTAARIRSWKEKFGKVLPVSVNVSRMDMLAPDLHASLDAILKEYGLDASDLILEITETAYTGETDQVVAMARQLRGVDIGFRIELDDFGTGYSSLGMLSKMPIDILKLDMSFVRSAFGEKRDVRMIQLIIDIADYLGVPVVAEGVETEDQMQTLRALGCALAQGYYFSRPVPPEAFEAFLKQQENSTI